MTDWPQSLEHYDEHRCLAAIDTMDGLWILLGKADAAIRDLKEMVERIAGERDEAQGELRDLTIEHLGSGPWCEECGRVTGQATSPEHPGKCNACYRAEKAEAEVERLREAWRVDHNALTDRASGLLSEVERLRCCGNCGNVQAGEWGICVTGTAPEDDPDGFGDETWKADIEPYDRCHFTPSRWTPCVEVLP